MSDVAAGRVVPKVYRQFKMYNDPRTGRRNDAEGVPVLTVLHVDTERGWRGGERQVLWLAAGMRDRGHRAVLVARRGDELAGVPRLKLESSSRAAW